MQDSVTACDPTRCALEQLADFLLGFAQEQTSLRRLWLYTRAEWQTGASKVHCIPFVILLLLPTPQGTEQQGLKHYHTSVFCFAYSLSLARCFL